MALPPEINVCAPAVHDLEHSEENNTLASKENP